MGIVVLDKELKYQVWNPFMKDLSGIPANKILGKHPTDFFSFLSDNKVIDKLNDLLKSGKYFQTEFKFKTNYKEGWANDFSRAIIDENNKIKGIISIVTDITERKLTEQKLIESEANYKNLIETASDAIYLMSEDGTIISTNEAACNMLGKSKDEILGVNIDSIDPNFPIDVFLKFWENISFNEQFIFETSHIRKDGTLVPVEISGQKYKQNEKVFYYGIARDISERKQANNKLKDSEERFRELVNTINSGVAIYKVINEGKSGSDYIIQDFNDYS